MKAFVLEQGELHIKQMPDPVAKEGEVVVTLQVAGLNRRDLHIPNRWGKKEDALILGSDGAGVVEAVGANVTNVSVGDEVIINPSLRWEKNSDAPPEGFDILGMPDHGTIAEKIAISADQLEKKPDYLSWEEAGVLALAALTGYRALVTKGTIQKEQTVFIPGAGSGVATYIIQFAKAMGAKVIVTSRSEEKREQALKLGADLAIDTNSDWEKELASETIDLVIDSVGRATFNRSLDVLKQGGKMVTFGATTEDTIDFNLRAFFYGQYQLFGSTMGSREELKELLAFMEKHEIKPVVGHTFKLDDVKEAFDLLEVNKQFGKIAIKM
ncbi:zinc-binding dehydrogenase [Pseudogracilibacillus auburnensis]|uniref:Zinc-binding alcohol dehydrogenase/oxidoreductase n=1 Tax=Pseudogracilibacillus auburnensis TaxID=1494959 RepID=A0A2V3W5A4_9BACI|nr:zinc-binding dehydrogenase [Pseudogracilibacillus auburnensis]MBO1003594.1 zinc-binding dehydrogenase [Pseudogracilibacillus auburnensis]PXW89282.1 zinc-binding alcohol dehydrogenase/oxidoreductase [Pseudogracilibacillus auburnensis]